MALFHVATLQRSSLCISLSNKTRHLQISKTRFTHYSPANHSCTAHQCRKTALFYRKRTFQSSTLSAIASEGVRETFSASNLRSFSSHISCSLQLSNKTNNNVAFKVKTTNPEKYCVRPNTGIVVPHSACVVTVTMQAQKEAPHDMQCQDKFLLQSAVASTGDITAEMFNKESGNHVEECKLRVSYVPPPQPPSPVREGSEEGSSPRASVSDNGTINRAENTTPSSAYVDRGYFEPQDNSSEETPFPVFDSPSDCVIRSTGELLSIEPQELQFPFELKKQISCSLQLSNKTNNNIAFKVKTTNPKKYCVRPNTGIVAPHSACDVIVTMQAQKEAPCDMQCQDKFLLQSAVASTGDITTEMFNKESGNHVEECKLRVSYIPPPQPPSPVGEGSEEGSSPRASVSDNGTINRAENTALLSAYVDRGYVEPQDNSSEFRAFPMDDVPMDDVQSDVIPTTWNTSFILALRSFFIFSDRKCAKSYIRSSAPVYRHWACSSDAWQSANHHNSIVQLTVDEGKWTVSKNYSWHEYHVIREVKDQGQLKICYAMAAATVIESIWMIVFGERLHVELDSLINSHPDSNAYLGGMNDWCLQAATTYGFFAHIVETNEVVTRNFQRKSIDGFITVPQRSEFLVLAVAQQPVLAVMNIGPIFKDWKGKSVYNGEKDGVQIERHAVVVVGYGESEGQKYFVIQNSWGPQWGDGGTIRVARGLESDLGVGGLYLNCMYPIIYEGFTHLDLLLHSYGGFYNRERIGLVIPLQSHTVA